MSMRFNMRKFYNKLPESEKDAFISDLSVLFTLNPYIYSVVVIALIVVLLLFVSFSFAFIVTKYSTPSSACTNPPIFRSPMII